MTLTPALSQKGEGVVVRRFPAQQPWANLVIAGAMGVRQDFYRPLATYLAANGINVLTFDYSGMGFSRQGSLRGCEADVSSWAEELDGVLGEADTGLPLFFLGHSLGGQLLGVLPRNERVRAAITVTAGSGWYRLNDKMPAQVGIFWFVAIPFLTPLFGYFPGKRLRMVGDLPRGVAWQWRKWCLHPEYLLAEGERYRAAFDRVRIPIRSYSFEDDPIITKAGVDSLNGFYRNAVIDRQHVDPMTLSPALSQGRGRRGIGHFGFFSAASQTTFWNDSVRWLRSRVESA